ncbi:tetratricopeptide repeat protein [Shimazuella alba]|uniref:Tetratricopeptide repeat protein n=1 Tax=Shimazuella alba TaxID=2690964 RepID=A0A6I4VS58_9BACL|nr:tetratricopeptide repeat protein [Shimazuella alba]MXQ53278.1 tetratricopeptide repeat protein [Shimazuella alba]
MLLKTIEHDIHLVGVNEAWKELNSIQLEPDDPLLGEYYFLLGQIYEAKQNWCKAQEFYEKAIWYIDNISLLNNSNIISGCYYGLGRILGKQSKLIQAIAILKKGEKYFIEGTERSYLKYNILLSQAIFLEKLNQNEEAFRITDELIDCKSLVASTEAKTNLEQLQATLLNKFGFYEQSIRISEEGMILARLDKLYDRTFELWTTRGESYRKKKEFINAKQCLKTALKLKQKIRYVPLTISTYTQLGLLYLELNNNQKAKTTLEQAVGIGKETKDKPHLVNALIVLGDCYLQKEQYTQAKKQ